MSQEDTDTGATDTGATNTGGGDDGPGPRVVLLTRASCTSCTAAADTLDTMGVVWRSVDVDAAAAQSAAGREQRAEFGDRVPVVLLDGREHSWGEVDVPRLRTDLGD